MRLKFLKRCAGSEVKKSVAFQNKNLSTQKFIILTIFQDGKGGGGCYQRVVYFLEKNPHPFWKILFPQKFNVLVL